MAEKDLTVAGEKAEGSENELTRRRILQAGATLAAGAIISPLLQATSAEAAATNAGAQTLILASHPYPERSVVNKALWDVAKSTPNAYFRNLESVFGSDLSGFDRDAERRLYERMQRLVLIFPTHWFNLTPMLKAYLNEIWGAGAPRELMGKELLVVTTTGGSARDYSRDGKLGFTIEEVLTPLRASAMYAGMTFANPLVFFSAASGDASLRGYQGALAKRLA